MAEEDEANRARHQHRRELLQRGAHAVGVENGRAYGKKGWVVVAHVAQADVKMPATLSCAGDNGDVSVPVVTVHSEEFKPE